MTPQEIDHWAKEAERLINDVVFVEALKRIRDITLDDLISVDATQIHDVVRLQAKISVIDEIGGEIKQMVMLRSLKNQPKATL